MAKTISIIEVSNDSFEDVFTIVSILANSFATTLTVSSNSIGETTSGNAYLNGIFSANTIVAGTSLRGGTVNASANLSITSNASFSGASVIVTANVTMNLSSFVLATNTSVNAVFINTTAISFASPNLNISSNTFFSGKSLAIPSGNTGNRPSSPASGMIRFNTETTSLEMYVTSEWQSFVSYANGTFNASSVSYANTANVTSQNVQAAITEVELKKVNRSGDTLTGNIIVNKNGITLPTANVGTIIHIGNPDSNNAGLEASVFEASAFISGRRADGTNASKSAVAANSTILKHSAVAYDGTSYAEVSALEFRTLAAQNTTSKSSRVVIKGIATGNTTVEDIVSFAVNNTVVNGLLSANSIAAGNANISSIVANTISASGGISGNGSSISSLDANNISTGTVSPARLPVANNSSNGAVATANSSEYIVATSNTKVLTPNTVWSAAIPVAQTFATTMNLNFSSAINFNITMTANATFGIPTNQKPGQSGFIKIAQDGSGNRRITFNSVFKFANSVPPALSNTAYAVDLLFYQVIETDFIYASLAKGVA